MGKPKAKPTPAEQAAQRRRELAEQLLAIEVDNRALFERMDALKSDLKAIATALGEGYREEFSGRGHVTVSGAKPKEFEGDLPEVDGDLWVALKQDDRNRLLKTGLVKLVPTWSRASYGRVDVKLF